MRWRIGVALLLIVVGVGVWSYLRPIPAVSLGLQLPATDVLPGTAPTLPWPSQGSGSIAVSGLGFLASSGNEQAIPAASVTKVMTALIILEDKPLTVGDAGPTLTLSEVDVQSYRADLADRESVVPVQVGEQLTELQLLEGLLIPSGNNYSETLARWDAGSVDAFVAKMNARAAALNLKHTNFADTSGASPLSTSTPSDLVVLGTAAMKQPVFAQVVAMTQAELPFAGTVYNVDRMLGQGGIVGIKTGSGLSTGANFLFAATMTVDGHSITLYGCLMGQETLDAAFSGATTVIAAVQQAIHVRRVLERNQTVATIVAPWGAETAVVSSVDVDLVEWPGMVLRQRLESHPIVIDQPVAPDTKEGSEHLTLGDYSLDVPLLTASPLYPPGRLWRLLRFSF
jgi:D-alanyl-D-alanine carboxypeptidase (penicillin-binding protein 5/6)